jgi:hypothetical protein
MFLHLFVSPFTPVDTHDNLTLSIGTQLLCSQSNYFAFFLYLFATRMNRHNLNQGPKQ